MYCVLIIILVSMLILLVACEVEAVTPTAEATLSGPTVEPSATFRAVFPGDEAPEEYVGISDPTAAALAPHSELPPLGVAGSLEGDKQSVQITAEDGTQLIGDLYMSMAVRQPGVLLFAPDRTGWGEFPTKLYNAGYTVLVLGMRDGSRMDDLNVALLSLSSGLAMPDRLAVMGAGEGADVALLGCAGEQLCKALILLSPSDSPGLVEAMGRYNPRPIFLTATQEDTPSFNGISALQSAATGAVFFQPFERAGYGTALLENRPDLGDVVVQWLGQYL